jgi:hypothetical protein
MPSAASRNTPRPQIERAPIVTVPLFRSAPLNVLACEFHVTHDRLLKHETQRRLGAGGENDADRQINLVAGALVTLFEGGLIRDPGQGKTKVMLFDGTQ